MVQSLAGPPGRWQIFSTDGIKAHWTRGGRELVYEGLDGRLMAVDIDTRTGFHAGTPHAQFALPSRSSSIDATSWGCDGSGEHFHLLVPPRSRNAGIIEVASGFHALVSRK